MKAVTGISIDDDLLMEIDALREISPGVRASRSNVFSVLLREALKARKEAKKK